MSDLVFPLFPAPGDTHTGPDGTVYEYITPPGVWHLKNESSSTSGTYEHAQLIPSTDWTIVHNLDGYPSVSVVDSAGSLFSTDVEYIDRTTLIVHITAAMGGHAYLN